MMNDASATKRLVALHGWSATVLAILLYVVMLTGTIVVVDNEITGWAEGRADTAPIFNHRTGGIVERFAAQVPADLHQEVFMNRGTNGTLSLFFGAPAPHPDGGRELFGRGYLVHPETGQLKRATAGFFGDVVGHRPEREFSHFLVDLHVNLHVPGRWGLYMTGILGVAMLVAAITGVLIHKHIVRDLFTTERPGKRLVSFRDRHTLAGVWSLPFAILLSFTGAFLSFAISLGLPVVALVAFGGDQETALNTVLGAPVIEDATPVPSVDLSGIIADANARVSSPVAGMQVHHYGTASAIVETIHGAPSGQLRSTTLQFEGATGEFIGTSEIVGSQPSMGSTIAALMAPLHFGNFAGWWSRIVWIALGAAMTYTIVTGMQLWLRRRQDEPAWRHGSRALSIVVWGLPLAIVICGHAFLVSYLAGDPEYWTSRAFVWGCVAVLAYGWITRNRPLEQVNWHMALALGIGLLLLPLVRLQMGGLSWGEAFLWGGDEVLIIDASCLILGLACLVLGRRPVVRPAEIAPSGAPAE